MFLKIVVFIIALGVTILILKYTEQIVRTFGKSVFAEKYLGAGGSYTMWKIIAVVVSIVAFMYLIGTFEPGGYDKLNYGVEQNSELDK